jgi:hypothetical protein
MSLWEYHVEQVNISERWSSKRQREEVEAFRVYLNKMGSEGWEMISYESVPLTGHFSGNIKGYAYLTFFKRPLGGSSPIAGTATPESTSSGSGTST